MALSYFSELALNLKQLEAEDIETQRVPRSSTLPGL